MLPIPHVDPTPQLNKLGEEGWELVSVYTTTETVFPNFGNKEYHTGVKSNTRTQTVNFVFKRFVTNTNDEAKSSKVVEDSVAVIEPVDSNSNVIDFISYGY